MQIYDNYNTKYGQIMLKSTLLALALALLTKGCSSQAQAHLDLVDPGFVVEMAEIEMAEKYKDYPKEGRPYCRLLEEKEEQERKEREDKEFEEFGYKFKYGIVDSVVGGILEGIFGG